jgi:predicted DNA-binding transcriptional regulator AlpA
MTTSYNKVCRKAFSLAEFAQLCGKHRSWAYRQAREGRIKTVTGFGTVMVPAHEIDRILGTAPQTNEG